MIKHALIFFVFIFLIACGSVKKHNEHTTKLHSVEALRSDVDAVHSQLVKHHPKLYQYTNKQMLDFKFDSLKKAMTLPINSREFYKQLAPVVAQIKQGHISVGSVSKRYTKKERKALKERPFEFYDLDFEYLNDKLWVIGNRGKDSTIIGLEVYRIDNELATNLVRIFKSRFGSDGYNQTLHNRVVGENFATFYFKEKGFSDSLKIEFKQKDSLVEKVFRRVLKEEKSGKKDSLASTKPKKLSKIEKREKRLKAKKKRKENRKRGYIASKNEYTRNFNFIGKDSTVAYMKIRSFANGNYRQFYKESFKTLDSLKTENLIIDLRDNGGGRISEIDYLYSFLTNKSCKFIETSEVNSRSPYLKSAMSNSTLLLTKVSHAIMSPVIFAFDLIKTKKIDGKIYYNLGFSKEKSPKKLHYDNQLYVITNGNSFSASSLISTHLKANNRAFFVGEETGGAYNGCVAGVFKTYQMPNSKLKIRIGLMQIEAPFKQTPDGFGIKPDMEILPILENRIQHKDPELDWILNATYSNEKS